MADSEYLDYFEYLKKRSIKGLFYRNFVVYPKIRKHIKGNLLDVGCGIGDMLKFYPNSVGVDINPYTVEYCNSKGLTAYLMEPNVLPFKKETFDTVLLDNVLEHLSMPSPLLQELKRVLRKTGRLIIGLPGKKGFLVDSDHKIMYSESDLAKLLQPFDFKVIKKFSTPIASEYLCKHMSRYCNFYVVNKSYE